MNNKRRLWCAQRDRERGNHNAKKENVKQREEYDPLRRRFVGIDYSNESLLLRVP